jgi:hypothetical protein
MKGLSWIAIVNGTGPAPVLRKIRTCPCGGRLYIHRTDLACKACGWRGCPVAAVARRAVGEVPPAGSQAWGVVEVAARAMRLVGGGL